MKSRTISGFKLVVVWWLLSTCIVGVGSIVFMGKEIALLNVVGATLFSIFLAIGVLIGSADEKIETPVLKEPPASLFEAYVEFKGGADSIIVCAKDKEMAKRLIIDNYPFGKILHFSPLNIDREFLLVANNV